MNTALALLLLTAFLCGCASHRPISPSKSLPLAGPLPVYSNARSWVETHCPRNNVPEGDRIFVIFDGRPDFAGQIVRYHEGITIDQILGQTSFPRPAYDIRVFRLHLEHGGSNWKPDSPYGREYFFKAGDVLWIRDRDYGSEIEIQL